MSLRAEGALSYLVQLPMAPEELRAMLMASRGAKAPCAERQHSLQPHNGPCIAAEEDAARKRDADAVDEPSSEAGAHRVRARGGGQCSA